MIGWEVNSIVACRMYSTQKGGVYDRIIRIVETLTIIL